jgi:hypothetical protein
MSVPSTSMYSYYVGSEILTAAFMMSIIFWDITAYSTFKFNGRFGGTYRLHFQANNLHSRWYIVLLIRP